MKNMMARSILGAAFLAVVSAGTGYGQSDTEFTYQGLLAQAGEPAEGPFDVSFTLWDAAAGGNQLAGPIDFVDLNVSGGLLTAAIDFGSEAFEMDEAYLEIVVEGVTLLPRQRITRVPLALQTRGLIAEDSTSASGLDVGIGTDNPLTRLHVAIDPVSGGQVNFSTSQVLTVDNAGESYIGVLSGEGEAGGLVFQQLNGAGITSNGILFDHPDGPDDGLQLRVANNPSLTVAPNGDIGIGTCNPQRKLHIADGDAGLDPNANSALVVEQDLTTFVNILCPDAFQSGLLFGNPSGGSAAGGIVFNSGNTPQGLQFRVNGNVAEMVLDATGQVGINTLLPGFLLEVNGTAGKPGGGSWSNSSDIRLKKNIRPLTQALNTLLEIEGVCFEYRDPVSINELPGQRIGVIAQQVETVMPDWVDENTRGDKTVTFRGFEALTVEALRELRAESNLKIARLSTQKDAEIDSLRQRIVELEQIVTQLVANRAENRK